jgi:hypothetical protein
MKKYNGELFKILPLKLKIRRILITITSICHYMKGPEYDKGKKRNKYIRIRRKKLTICRRND